MSLNTAEDEIKRFKELFEIQDLLFRDFIVSHLVSGREKAWISSKSFQARIRLCLFTFIYFGTMQQAFSSIFLLV
ncbi:unnamed protein product [Caenorhabditis nigoni]